jgi:hypothetical protein
MQIPFLAALRFREKRLFGRETLLSHVMRFRSFVLACALLFTLLSALTACSNMPAKSADGAPSAEGIPALSAEAKAALAVAENDYQSAKAKFALWTTTDTAFKAAQAAAKSADSAAVLRLAATVSEQTKLSLEQLNYPSTELQ